MKLLLATARSPSSRMLAVLVLVVAFNGGCNRDPVGEYCYDFERTMEIADPHQRPFAPMEGQHGKLSGLVDCRREYSGDCFCRIFRVEGSELVELLCISEQEQKMPLASDENPGDGLFLLVSGFPEWPVPIGLCWESPLNYELWDVVDGMQSSFSSMYGLVNIVSHERYLGLASPCELEDPEPSFEPALYLVDGSGQLLREHTGLGGVKLEGIDPTTRDYYLRHADGTFSGHNLEGQVLPLVIGDTAGCSFVGAQAGVHAFICSEEGSYSLVVGQSSGTAASRALATTGQGTVGGEGSVVAVVLESGQLQVYRFDQEQLDLLWTKGISVENGYAEVGLGPAPLIAASNDGETHVFDLQGRPAFSASGVVYYVGDVGEYVTILGESLETYRVYPTGQCGPVEN